MVLVEFTIVAPLLLLLVFGAIQGGLLIYLQHEMTSAARETTRRMAVGELKTTTAAESFAQTRMANTGMGLTFTYAAAFPTPPSTSATMTISISMANATIIDVFGHFGGGTLTGFAAMRME